MQEINFDEAVDLIVAKDSRFARDAYAFVREALDFTQKLAVKEARGNIRHVSGQELLGGIRQFALQQFLRQHPGPIARHVDAALLQFQQRDVFLAFARAQDHAQGRGLVRLGHLLGDPE